MSINRPDDFVFGTVGRPAPGSEVMIEAETGEILVRGPQVMQGYLNQPEETAKAIDADGWFHTGDIGELDEIGRIRITDRLKNIIILGNGKNVSPGADGGRAVDLAVHRPGGHPRRPPGLHRRAHRPRLRRARQHGPRPTGWPRCRRSSSSSEKAVDKLFDAEVKRTLDGFADLRAPAPLALLPRPCPRRPVS